MIPSAQEAYGLVAAESLAYGSIPIVSEVGDLVDVISPYPTILSSRKHGARDAWTGFSFPLFNYPEPKDDLSGRAVSTVIQKAVRVLKDERQSGRSQDLIRRLIRSAPWPNDAAGVSDSLRAYEALITFALSQATRTH